MVPLESKKPVIVRLLNNFRRLRENFPSFNPVDVFKLFFRKGLVHLANPFSLNLITTKDLLAYAIPFFH